MRIITETQTAAIAVSLIAGCAGGGSASGSLAVPAGGTTIQSQVRSAHTGDPTGVAPKFLRMLRFGRQYVSIRRDQEGAPKELAVSDFGTGAVEILNSSYALSRSISNGLNGPDGDFVDGNGNLYVANYGGINVQEYPKRGTSPSATYASGLVDPVGVTTDASGNVYAADNDDGDPSVVVEYAQGDATPLNSCYTGLANEGIAVDNKGDVFVSGNSTTGGGNIIEYKGGLSTCSGKTLRVTLTFAGGLQIDNERNLVACDQLVGVDIIPPPYRSISSTITGAADTFHVALNKENSLIYIADPAGADVLVDDYPSGTNITTLNSSNGLSDPAGVATYPYQKK